MRAEFQNSSKCSNPFINLFNVTVNLSYMNLIDTITSHQHHIWNFSRCINKSCQLNENKSVSKLTDSELVSKNYNLPIKKSKKWKFNSEKCNLNFKRKINKFLNFLLVLQGINKMPKNNRQSLLKSKKKPPNNQIVLKHWPMKQKNNALMPKKCWMILSKKSSNLKKNIWTKSDLSTIPHLQLLLSAQVL